jgi:hypothetical protein
MDKDRAGRSCACSLGEALVSSSLLPVPSIEGISFFEGALRNITNSLADDFSCLENHFVLIFIPSNILGHMLKV